MTNALIAKLISDCPLAPPADGLPPSHTELEHQAALSAHTDNSHHLAELSTDSMYAHIPAHLRVKPALAGLTWKIDLSLR
ncbi:COMM domain-containing protein [Operophtera brumata]|uniref:COMM domain-containing protein n=1 Tax=Operophtera brumata TaxID=104452 RepID=A0A0L7LCJ1_OPEBR|nr:COMM domain-containing protein [Operophtera brumata]